jgi:AcrR family transcriptional regulator
MGRHKTLPDSDVLKIARQTFLKSGHGASTREVAEAVGLSQATLFQRFGDKSDLFVAAMLPEPLDIEAIVHGANKCNSGQEIVTDIALRLFETMRIALPLIQRIAGYPDLQPSVLEATHERINVPGLIKAMERRIAYLQADGMISKTVRASQLVESLLIGVHGIILMSHAGTAHGKAAEVKMLRRFVTSLLPS